MNSEKMTSILRLSPLIVISLILLYLSLHFFTSSLHQIGLENEVDRYSEFMLNNNSQDPDLKAQAEIQRERIDTFADELLMMNSSNPDVLELLGYVAKTNYWDGNDPENSLLKAGKMYRSASQIRPLFSNSYVEVAYVLTYQNQSFDDVSQQLALAEHFGPYQASTARAGIDILFSNWAQLDTKQRLQAMNYFTEHAKYGLHRFDLNDLIAVSLEKEKLCSVANFIELKLSSCR